MIFCVFYYNNCIMLDTVVPIGVYAIQHYVSMIGSLILIPLVIVPAMGGTHVSDFRLASFFPLSVRVM